MSSLILAALFGVILGLRFKVVVLILAFFGLMIFYLLDTAQADVDWSRISDFFLALILLQIGYFTGACLHLVRPLKHRTRSVALAEKIK